LQNIVEPNDIIGSNPPPTTTEPTPDAFDEKEVVEEKFWMKYRGKAYIPRYKLDVLKKEFIEKHKLKVGEVRATMLKLFIYMKAMIFSSSMR